MNVIESQMSLIYYAELSILQIRGLFFVLSIFCLVAMVALYRKGGRHGWEVFVPFYCDYVMCDMVYGDGWLFIIRFIPIPVIRIIFSLYTLYQFSKLYGCGPGMALGCTFFPYIFMPILAWGNGHISEANNGKQQILFIRKTKLTQGKIPSFCTQRLGVPIVSTLMTS